MIFKLAVALAVFAVCNAGSVWIAGQEYLPGVIMRIGRSPQNMAFGYGTGFSSNIGGIGHSTGLGAAFQSGDAQAYGAGMGGANGNFARGIGAASAAPAYPYPYGGYNNDYQSAVSAAQNFGNYGSAMSVAQGSGPARYQSAASAAQNMGLGYESALSAVNGGGYESAASAAEHGGDYGSAVASASNQGYGQFGAAVSAAQTAGDYRGSTAQALQHHAGGLRSSGASSINGPGLQAAHSHAFNTGYY